MQLLALTFSPPFLLRRRDRPARRSGRCSMRSRVATRRRSRRSSRRATARTTRRDRRGEPCFLPGFLRPSTYAQARQLDPQKTGQSVEALSDVRLQQLNLADRSFGDWAYEIDCIIAWTAIFLVILYTQLGDAAHRIMECDENAWRSNVLVWCVAIVWYAFVRATAAPQPSPRLRSPPKPE